MKRPLFAAILTLASAVGAEAGPQWQATIRERIVSSKQHLYGNDSALRVRRDISDIRVGAGENDMGFKSFVLTTRLQMESPTASYVYKAMLSSERTDIETMISSVLLGKAEVVVKPMISTNGDVGVANRITDVNPADPHVWFTSYAQTLKFYTALSLRREIHELVIGTGLHNLWKPAHATAWIDLAQDVRRKMGVGTKLSIELSSAQDVAAMEAWKLQDPASFESFSSELDRVRFSSPMIMGPYGWDVMKTKAALEDNHQRVRALFPRQPLTLAEVKLPACRALTEVDGEVVCNAGAPFDKIHQVSAIRMFFRVLRMVPAELRNDLATIDVLMATTDREPDDWNFDPRFPFYNPEARKRFVEEFNQGLEPVIAPTAVPVSGGAGRGPASVSTEAGEKKLACAFFDSANDQDYIGAIHARMFSNLMGAFPNWENKRISVRTYRAGDMDSCDVVFYIATHFSLEIPKSFLEDIVEASHHKNVIWMNYKFDKFVHAFERGHMGPGIFPFLADRLDQPLRTPTPKMTDPGFYRYFDYKGETFEKLARWDYFSNRFMSSPELTKIEIVNPRARVDILATARHSELKDKNGKPLTMPYAVRTPIDQGALWYFADSPFSYVHYEDRYLILCDLMWDILGEKAPDGPLGALVRIEDVNPSQNSKDLRWAIDYMASEKVPFALAVIPYYANMFGTGFTDRKPVVEPSYLHKDFVGSLRYAKAMGGELVWHGVYHQAGDLLSGFDGTSGPDYEFWLYPEDKPIPADSPDFVLDQLEKGEQVFEKIGIRPVAWEVPHYASSALDSVLFGKLFQWNYHRSLYFWSDVKTDAPLTAKHRMFDCTTPECRQERRELARKTDVKVYDNRFAGQPVPYRVFKDSYGQALIPETLGMIDYVFYTDHTWRPVSNVEDLLRRAKKLRVVRGSFASFFWHPDVASENLPYYQTHPGHYEREGGKNTLIRLVRGLKELGYEFKSVGDCKLFPRDDCPPEAN